MLTPLDIHNKDFKRGMRGYSPDEVDDFLDEVVRDFETLLKQNDALQTQVDELRTQVEQYRQMEDTLRSALVVAQETAEEVKAAGRKEAELVVREAQGEAERRVQQAEGAVQRAHQALAEMERNAQAFRARVRSLLEGQIEVLRRDENWSLDLPDDVVPPADGSDNGSLAGGASLAGESSEPSRMPPEADGYGAPTAEAAGDGFDSSMAPDDGAYGSQGVGGDDRLYNAGAADNRFDAAADNRFDAAADNEFGEAVHDTFETVAGSESMAASQQSDFDEAADEQAAPSSDRETRW